MNLALLLAITIGDTNSSTLHYNIFRHMIQTKESNYRQLFEPQASVCRKLHIISFFFFFFGCYIRCI